MSKPQSEYSASFTGATMMFEEMNVVVESLQNNDTPETIKNLKTDPQYLKINSASARDRVTIELVKRYRRMPKTFWDWYVVQGESQKRLALLFVILKTYKLLFEFQVNFAIPKYNSIDRTVNRNDVLAAMSEVASRDEFVDSWTEKTRQRASTHYVTILRQAGLVNEQTDELQIPEAVDEDFLYYVQNGEVWFLQACFIPGYRIEQIKQLAI